MLKIFLLFCCLGVSFSACASAGIDWCLPSQKDAFARQRVAVLVPAETPETPEMQARRQKLAELDERELAVYHDCQYVEVLKGCWQFRPLTDDEWEGLAERCKGVGQKDKKEQEEFLATERAKRMQAHEREYENLKVKFASRGRDEPTPGWKDYRLGQ